MSINWTRWTQNKFKLESKFGVPADEFNVYTREAGPGKLSIGVEGSSKAVMQVVDGGHGYTTVSYKVSKPGTIYYNQILMFISRCGNKPTGLVLLIYVNVWHDESC